MSDSEKLQKALAAAGLGSRRELESWIRAGRITVNDELAHIGQRVALTDVVKVDGRRVRLAAPRAGEILLLNKRPGTVCTRHDPEGRPTVYSDLPALRHGRWVSVGRLDLQTSGLLLLTNDGELAHKLMHPSTGIDREYAVRVSRHLEDAELEQLQQGLVVDDELLKFSDIQYYDGRGTNHWYHVVLLKGKNREVRRLFDAMSVSVSRLKRVRYGPVILPSWLRVGAWTSLQTADVRRIYRLLGMTYQAPQKPLFRERRVAKSSCLLDYPKLPSATVARSR